MSIDHISLNGSFSQMGEQYSQLRKDYTEKQLLMNKEELCPTGWLFNIFFNIIVNRVLSWFPDMINEEMKEYKKSQSEFSGISVKDLYYLSLSMPVSTIAARIDRFYNSLSLSTIFGGDACTFGGYKTCNGWVVGKNMDWGVSSLHALTYFPLITSFSHSDKKIYPYKVTTIAPEGSEWSSLTAVNDQGVYITVNSGEKSVGGSMKIRRPFFFSDIIPILMKYKSAREVSDWLLKTPMAAGFIICISDIQDVFIVECCPYDCSDLKDNNKFVNRLRTPEGNIIAATNYFKLDNWEEITGHPPIEDPNTSANLRYSNMINMLENNMTNLEENHLDTLQSIFERAVNQHDEKDGILVVHPPSKDYPDQINRTHYTVLFDSYSKILRVRFQQLINNESRFLDWNDIYIG